MRIVIDKDFQFELKIMKEGELQKIDKKTVIFANVTLSINNIEFSLCLFLLVYDGKYAVIASSFTDNEKNSVSWFEDRFNFFVLVKNQNEVDIFANDFLHKRQNPLPLLLIGTKFRCKVWSELLLITLGETGSYKSLAQRCKLPNPQKSARAVGGAVAANNISYLIPCHRILRSDETLGGYAWGIKTKKKLLDAENRLAVSG